MYTNYYTNNTYKNQIKQEAVKTNNISNFDTIQKAWADLVGEIQAIIEYDAHANSTNDKLAKETWINIKNEELVHVGELLGLLNYLDPSQRMHVEEGWKEFQDRLQK